MKYLLAFVYIAVFHIVADLLALVSDLDDGSILASLAIGGTAILAADYHLTKEGD